MKTARTLCILACLSGSVPAVADEPSISAAKRDEHGILVYEVKSPYQGGTTQIRVLISESLKAGEQYPVVYVLPVEARNETRYGDSLLEIKKSGLQNRHRVLFVAPTFSHLPWYADHPKNAGIRQESHLLKVVVPFVEKAYPARPGRDGRLLLGFSKSGWGAWSLLLRHPDVFGKAAAWDAPLNKQRPDQFGMGDIFGTQANFEDYRISSLLQTRAERLGPDRRLILLGFDNFRDHHDAVHALLEKLQIPHDYRDGPQRKHAWESGWLAEAVELLMRDQ